MSLLVGEGFEGHHVKDHYTNAKSLAVSYLMAMGAKALALTELSAAGDVNRDGLTIESELAHKISCDRLRMKLSDPNGYVVQKKARNGTTRSLSITLRINAKTGDYLEWSSKTFGQRKTFLLSTLRGVDFTYDLSADAKSTSRLSRTSQSKGEEAGDSGLPSPRSTNHAQVHSNAPFVSLTNDSRTLGLRFASHQDSLVFADLIKTYYIANTNTNTSKP
jgi:hypothetical protein